MILKNFSETITEKIEIEKNTLKLSNEVFFAIKKIYQTIKKGGKVFICGNGGSAADAQHLAAEFLVRLRPNVNRRAFPVISLALDTSTITACGNDLGYSQIFSRTLSALGKQGDILIVISTSGNSKNIINVLKESKKKKIFSIALLGNNGGKVKKFSDLNIIVPSKITARIQECHIFLGHFIFEEVENLLIKKKK